VWQARHPQGLSQPLQLLLGSGAGSEAPVYAANCATLADALTTPAAVRDVLGNVPVAVLLVLAGAVTHGHHGGASCWSLALLDVLLASEEARTASAQALRVAVALLRAHAGDAEVFDAAARVVHRCVGDLGPASGANAAAADGTAVAIVGSMGAGADDARLQARACKLLVELAGAGERVRLEAASAGAPRAALAAMASFPGDCDVQAAGCACLAAYVTTQAAASSSPTALDACLAALATHGADRAVVTAACDAVTALCRVSQAQAQALHARDGAALLTAQCQAHTGDAGACASAASALASLCAGCPGACTGAVACGAVGALCDALFVHTKDPALCNAATAALARLLTAPGCPGLLRKAGGVHAAVAALKQHAGSPAVAGRAASLIARAALAGLCKEALAGGAPGALVEVMQQHPGHSGVMSCVSLAVSALGSQPDGAAELVASSAVPALVRVLASAKAAGASRPVDAASCAASCGALHKLLASSSFACAQAAQCGALGALTAAARAHPSDTALCRAVCACVTLVAPESGHPGEPGAAASACMDTVLAMLATHGSGSSQLVAASCASLVALCSGSPQSARRAVASGGLNHVCAALHVHGSQHAAVAQAGAMVLQTLTAGDGDAKDAAARCGAVQLATECLQAHAASPEVAAACAGALGSLAVSEANQAVAADCGSIEAVVAALLAHGIAHPRCAAQCCVALTNLAANAANEERAVAARAQDAVLLALKAHPGSANVVEEACAALANLSFAAPHAQAARELGVPDAVRAARAAQESVPSAVAQADYVLEALAAT
jgi:hypothetical protein